MIRQKERNKAAYTAGRISRLLCAVLLAWFIFPSAEAAAQNDARFNINMQNVSLRQVFDEVERQSDYIFSYTSETPVSYQLSINVSNATLDAVMEEVLTPNHSYRINGRQIAVSYTTPQEVIQQSGTGTVEGTVTDSNGEPLIGANVSIKNTIFGTTTDMYGKYTLRIPMNALAGTKIVFGYLGKETLEVDFLNRTNIDAVLRDDLREIEEVVVTGITNMQRRDMVGSFVSKNIEDIYKPGMTSVDEMLAGEIPGLVVTKSSFRAGSKPQLTIRGNSTFLGVTEPLWVIDGVIQSDMPSIDGAFTQLDGVGSTQIMNDFVGSAISWLSPNDIENVTVLKDASATAIYGSRASNGVIVITTKKGSNDRLSINFNAGTTIGARPRYSDYNVMNSQDRINFSREAFDAGAFYYRTPLTQPYTYEGLYTMFLGGEVSEEQFMERYKYLESVNTDWLKLLTRTSVSQNYNLSIAGGTRRASYNSSISYVRQDGTEKGNGTERLTGRIAIGSEISPKLRVDLSLIGSLTTTTGYAGGVSPLNYATTTSRAVPAYEQDGSPVYYKWLNSDSGYKYDGDTKIYGFDYNIMEDMANTSMTTTMPVLRSSLNLKYFIIPDLTYELVAGLDLQSRKAESWMGENSFYIIQNYRGYRMGSAESFDDAHRKAALLPYGGMLQTDDTFQKSYSIRNQITYSKTFNELHRVNLLGLWEISSSNRNSTYNTVWGYDRDRGQVLHQPTTLTDFTPINGGNAKPTDYTDIWRRLASGFWRSTLDLNNKTGVAVIGTYSFDNRYVVNANFRNDWSNRFGQNANRRFNPTWSVGFMWRITSEPFMQGRATWLDRANLSVTYGLQGNELDRTPEMTLTTRNVHSIFGEPYSTILTLANPYLTWEKTKTWNGRLEFGVFRTLDVVVDGYTRLTDAGRSLTLPNEYGAGSSMTMNGTMIRNSGIEAALSARVLATPDWNLTLTLNAGRNWNKVVSQRYVEGTTPSVGNYLTGSSTAVLETGYAMGSFWAYSFRGLNDENGLPMFNYLQDENGNAVDSEGNPIMADGSEITDYLEYAGSTLHNFSGGFTLSLRYRRFNLRASFLANLGAKAFLPNPYNSFNDNIRLPDPVYNLSKELNDRWRQPGDAARTDIPGLYTYSNSSLSQIKDPNSGDTKNIYNMWANSTARVASKSTLRCQTISLTYNYSGPWLTRIGVNNMALSASVNNVFLIADKRWNGMDPDMGGTMREPVSCSFGLGLSF